MKKDSLESFVEKIKAEFKNCADFNCRKFTFCKDGEGYLMNIGGYTDRSYITDSILRPILLLNEFPKSKKDLYGYITSSEFSEISDIDDTIQKLLTGFAVIILRLESEFAVFGCMAKRTGGRSVSEPDSEVVVRGPREGFIESAEDNLSLLRKRFKTADFKSLRIIGGDYTKTTIYITYIEGIAKPETINRIKAIIQNIKMPGIIDSGFIEHYLQKKTPSLFTNVGNSEKPDVVAAKLLEGRIAIICDGSPVIITLPYLFIESIQSAEDYLKTPYYATFMRFLRFFSTIISLYLPAFYLATVEQHTSALPYKLYKTVIKLRQDVPFDVFGELMVILFIFELIREVGIRMPRAVGDAVGIVAGLILGDAAISAGLASAPVIMVASLTAVCTFIIPTFMNSIVLIRFINIFLAKLFGFSGIIISALFILCCLCRKESFGVPYLFPLTPFDATGLNDTLTVNPKKALKTVKAAIYRKDNTP